MADEKQTISNEMQWSAPGLDEVEKKVQKLSDTLGSMSTVLEKINDHFDKLSKAKIPSAGISTTLKKGDTSIYQEGGFTPRQQTAVEEYTRQLKAESAATTKLREETAALRKERQKLVQQQTEAQKNKNLNYAHELANESKKYEALLTSANAYSKKIDANEKFLRYRGDHPEQFTRLRGNKRYEIGRGVAEIGGVISSAGGFGSYIGGAMGIAGSWMAGGPMAALATVGIEAARALKHFASSAVEAYGQIESVKVQLGVVTGSDTQAASLFNEISEYAVRSPFGVEQTSELAILLRQSGVYASDLMDTLKMIGDTAGGNMEKFKRIANNYAQIVSIGKASMLDMRQFAYAGIPIFEAVSKELGVSQAELRQLISDGKITSNIIEKVFKDLTGINGIFHEATKKGAETFNARLQNYKDTMQLAFSQLGEYLVNAGGTYANNYKDSMVGTGMSFAESVTKGLGDWAEGQNIALNVQKISERNSRIETLQRLIDYDNAGGGENKSVLAKALEEELAKIDPEKDRAVHYQSYLYHMDEFNKNKEWAEHKYPQDTAEDELQRKKYTDTSINKKFQRIARTKADEMGAMYHMSLSQALSENEVLKNLYSKAGKGDSAADEAYYNELDEYYEGFKAQREAWQAEEDRLIEAHKAIKRSMDVTPEDTAAMYATNALQAQSDTIEDADRKSNQTDSVRSFISEMNMRWKSSDTYQQQLLDNQKKNWQDTIRLLEEIKPFIRNTVTRGDVLELSKGSAMSAADFMNYLGKGALESSGRLAITTDDPAKLGEDRRVISQQLSWLRESGSRYIDSTMGSLHKKERETLLEIFNSFYGGLNEGGTDKTFVESYQESLTKATEALDKFIKYGNHSASGINTAGNLRTLLGATGVSWTADLSALSIPLDELFKESDVSKVFIPLWKRILSSATGLSANVISGTDSALDAYSDNVAVRSRAAGVIQAAMRNGGGADVAQKLLMTTGKKVQLPGDKGYTYQIDWAKTSDAVKEFSMRLRASTDVIDAYVSSLEQQEEAYISLMSNGLTQQEMSDIRNGGTKSVSGKKFSEMMGGYDDQLVNAFGEALETNFGEKIDRIGADGTLYGADGKELMGREVRLTGNLFDKINELLPKIRKEISDANTQQVLNKIYGKLAGSTSGSRIKDSVASRAFRDPNMAGYLKILGYDSIIEVADLQVERYLDEMSKNVKAGEKPKFKDVSDVRADMISNPFGAGALLYERALSDIGKAFETLGKSSRYMSDEQAARSEAARNNLMSVSEPRDSNVFSRNSFLDGLFGAVSAEMMNIAGLDSSVSAMDMARTAGASGNKLIANAQGNITPGTADAYIEQFKDFGMPDDFVSKLELAKGSMTDMQSVLAAMASEWKKLNEEQTKMQVGSVAVKNAWSQFGQEVASLSMQAGKQAFLSPFQTLGECLVTGDDASEAMAENLRKVGAQFLQNIGSAMATAGFNIAAGAALQRNWGMVAAGLALAAAGGFASGIGGALGAAEQSEDETGDESAKLESMKDALADLLEQARTDALYYENNLRHKTALGINKSYSDRTVSVHDAVITPSGTVVKTDPKDYLIASKTPHALVGGNGGGTSVSVVVNNNSKANVSIKRQDDGQGNVNIVAIVEDIIGGYIASDRSDDAFSALAARQRGRRAVMS